MIEAYKIGVTISATNHVSSVLRLIGRDTGQTHAEVQKLQRGLDSLKISAAVGAGLAAAGAAGLKLMHGAYEAAKGYEQMYATFKALNLGDVTNQDADKFARASRIYGVSATDLMGTLRDLHTVMGDYDHAKRLAPFIAEMEYANKAVGVAGAKKFTDGERRAMGKVLEIRKGFESDQEMRTQAELMQRVMSGTSFTVLPSAYQTFLSTGKVAAQLMANEDFYYSFEPLIQELGGNSVGTGVMTSWQRLHLGQGAGSPGGKAYVELLSKLGLVDNSRIEHNQLTGKITKVQAGFLKDDDLFQAHPQKWLMDVLIPSLKAHGVTSDADIVAAISQVYGRTGGNIYSKAYLQREKIAKNVGIDTAAMGVADLVKLAKTTPEGAEIALGKAFENLKIAAGKSIVPIIIPALLGLTDVLKDLGVWIDSHPFRFDALIKGFTALSGVMTFGGTVLLLTSAFKGLGMIFGVGGGPIAWVILGLTAAVAGAWYVYDHWAEIKPKLMSVWHDLNDWFNRFCKVITDGLAMLWAKVKSVLPDWMVGAGSQAAEAPKGDVSKISSMMPAAIPKTRLATGGASLDAFAGPDGYMAAAIPPPQSKKITIEVPVNLDGRPISKVVAEHWSDEMNRPNTGASTFDGRFGFVTP